VSGVRGLELRVNALVVIPAAELAVEQAASSGPGGQSVNKTASKVVLRFSVLNSLALSPEDRDRLLERLAARLTRSGELVIHAERFRSAERNLKDARKRLSDMLAVGLAVPKVRRATRPKRSAARKRVEGKRRRSTVKRGRKSAHSEE
jgi:ribosome-associated protein